MYRKRSVLLSAGLAVALAIAVIAAVSAWDRVGPSAADRDVAIASPSVVSSPAAAPTAAASAAATTPATAAAPSAAATTPAPGYGTEPPGVPTSAPVFPPEPLPDPAGSPLPTELIGRQYNVDPPALAGSQALVLTLRAADDPHCVALYEGRSTCFTILFTPNWPKQDDPAVRGSARMVGGRLVLGFSLVPYDPPCEGTTSTYAVDPGGDALRGIDVPACSFRDFTKH